MRRIIVLVIVAIAIIIILYACNLGSGSSTPQQENASVIENVPSLGLTVQAQAGTFDAVGKTISYVYAVTNTGSTVLAGPVTVTDDKATVTCPEVNTVGNLDNNLDPAESVNCSSAYTITQEDLNAGSVKNNSTASAGGVNSSAVSTTVQMTLAKMLELTSIPNPTTYNQAGQVITFTYTIKNLSANALGPAQFVINDSRLGAINCDATDKTLAPNEAITCSATYTTTETDKSASQMIFNSVASGGGATINEPISVAVNNTGATNTPSSNSNLTKGSTIQHQVNEGEWMLQITRCYGADYRTVRDANPQVIDPDKIWPINTLAIPNIGSNGQIYGPPCVTYYTAQAGDTWTSIAQKYNADLAVLQEANKTTTLANGVKLKIPLNSANGNPVPNQPPSGNNGGAIRLNLSASSNTVKLSGTVTVAKNKERYVLTATQGQTLKVSLTGPSSGLELIILATNGTKLKEQDTNLSWSGKIPSNGDYYIDVINASGTDRLYNLDVALYSEDSAFQQVTDINTTGDSSPSYLTVFNSILFFNAIGSDNAGSELWKFDGNTVSRAADIALGAEGSNPQYLTPYDNALYFSANGNDDAGVELWRFNGTDAGRLTDINNGPGDANPSYMTVFNGRLYFSANGNDGAGVELWSTDGINAKRATDIYSETGDANPAHLAVYKGALYFSATSNDGAGTELWKYDGTEATRVADINQGVGNSNPSFLTVFNDVLYFSANGNDGAGIELWKYDGTSVARAADINAGAGDSVPSFLTVFNNALYFGANGNDGAGYELWKFDGTNATRISDLNKNGDTFPSFLRVFNGELYFQANGGDGAGKELWKYRGP